MAVSLMVSLNQSIDPLAGTAQNYSARNWCERLQAIADADDE
jgi:hypothetical protein